MSEIYKWWLVICAGMALGLLTYFSSPSSEVRAESLGSGFNNQRAGVSSTTTNHSQNPNSCSVHIKVGRQHNFCPKEFNPADLEIIRTIVTAYCKNSCCCGKWADGTTASGHIIKEGDKFAAAPPEIPFGTLLSIDDYAEGLPVPVLDRGGAIKQGRLDVYFDSHNAALKWGRRNCEVRYKK